jgi:hypothetical protein
VTLVIVSTVGDAPVPKEDPSRLRRGEDPAWPLCRREAHEELLGVLEAAGGKHRLEVGVALTVAADTQGKLETERAPVPDLRHRSYRRRVRASLEHRA